MASLQTNPVCQMRTRHQHQQLATAPTPPLTPRPEAGTRLGKEVTSTHLPPATRAYSAARPTPGVTMSSISISLALLAVALASGMRKARMRMAVASGRRGRRFGSRRRLVGVASRSACVACAGLQQSSNRPGRSDSLPSWRVHSAWCSPRCASKHGFAASLLRSTLGGQCTMPVASSGALEEVAGGRTG